MAGKGCGTLIAGVLVLAGIGAVYNAVTGSEGDDSAPSSPSSASSTPSPKPSTKPIGDKLGVQVVCQDFVKDRLKSPSSADFSSEVQRHIKGPLWVAAGDVDSDNAFGAPIRNQYVCRVRYKSTDKSGNDNYTLVNLTGLTN